MDFTGNATLTSFSNAPTKPATPIQGELEILEKELHQVNETIRVLEDRLGFVLRPEPPIGAMAQTADGSPTPATAPLTFSLSMQRNILATAQTRLRSILDRLDL